MNHGKTRGAWTLRMRGGARLALTAGTVAGLIGAVGCSSAPTPERRAMVEAPPVSRQPPRDWDPSQRPVTESLTQPVASAAGPQLVGQQRLTAPPQTEGVASSGVIQREPGEVIHLQYHANRQDVTEVIQAILGETLKRDYVLDSTIQGQITIDIDDEMTSADVMDLVEGLATVFNWSIEERGSTLFIKAGVKGPRSSTAPVLSAKPALESELGAVRVRRLRYLGGEQIVTALRDFMSESAKAVTVGRTVVMADTTRQIARMSELLSALDTPAFEGVTIWTYQLGHRRSEDAAQLLQTIAAASSINTGPEPNAAFIALPNTRRLMVVARDPSIQPLVGDLIRTVDTPPDREPRLRYKYNIQHYDPPALVKLMRDFFGDRMETSPTDTGEPPRIRLAHDAASDVLLIYATPSDYAELLSTLQAVDRPPQQVQLQSIIAEVSLTNRLQWGVEYFLETASDLGELALTGSAPLVGASTGSALFVGASGFAVIQALDRESDTQILSQPKIFLRDRAEAFIQVGGEVPVIRATEGSQTQQGGTSGIREEIEYRKTGVILTLQAMINESGLVRLDITQEVTDAIPTSQANQPEFTTRNIETSVVVPHGQTVILGGIITTDVRNSTSRIPILGRIPVVGEAFKSSDDTAVRRELLLAITPTIVNDPSMARGLTTEFLAAAGAIRAILNKQEHDLERGVLYDTAPEAGDVIDAEPAPEESEPAQEEISLGAVGGDEPWWYWPEAPITEGASSASVWTPWTSQTFSFCLPVSQDAMALREALTGR